MICTTNIGVRAPMLEMILMIVITAVSFAAMPASAKTGNDANIKHKSVSVQTFFGHDEIEISSSDGVHWDTIGNQPLKITANMQVDTWWPGYVAYYGLFLGGCDGADCVGTPRLYASQGPTRDLARNAIFWFSPDEIPMSPFGPQNVDYAREMGELCEQYMSETNSQAQDILYNHELPVTLSANTGTATNLNNVALTVTPEGTPEFVGDTATNDMLNVVVRCKGLDQPELEPVNLTQLQVFLTTYHDNFSKDTGLLRCPRLGVKVRATADAAGPVNVRLLLNQNGDLSHQDVTMQTIDLGDGLFEAEFNRWVDVKEYTFVQALAMEMAAEGEYPTGIDSGWKDIPLICQSSGGDGKLVFETDSDHGAPDRPDDHEPVDSLFGIERPSVPPLPPQRFDDRLRSE